MIIIKNEEQRTNGCSSVEVRIFCGHKATKQSSLLVRVAVVFYVLGLTLGFADNNRYRVLPDVKGDPHVLSPLSVQGVGTAASFRSSLPLARLLYLWKFLSHVKVFQWAAPLRHMHGRSALPLHG